MSIIKTKTGMATTTYGYDEKGKNYRYLISYSQNTAFYTTDGMRFEFWTAKPQNLILYETGVHIGKGPHSHDMYSYYSGCGSYGLLDNPNNSIVTPCIISVDVNGDRKPNPKEYNHLGQFTRYEIHPTSEKFGDIFSIMITDNGAVPYGYQAQKAMYGKN